MHKIKLPHAGRGGDSRGGSDRGKGKKRWGDKAASGWNHKGLATVCSSEAVSCNQLQDASSRFRRPESSLLLFLPNQFFSLLSPLTLFLFSSFPPYPLRSLFTTSPFCLLLLISHSLHTCFSSLLAPSALWLSSAAMKSNPLMGVWEFW